jgi:peptidoglycan/xylan/chitin deacetylase (PgdA/CDA1 family)
MPAPHTVLRRAHPPRRGFLATACAGSLALSCAATATLGAGCAASAARPMPGADAPGAIQGGAYDRGGLIRGPLERREIALVFAGGAFGEGAAWILDALAARRIRAAFFLTGEFLCNPVHAPAIRQMVADGHYVGPHSHGHPLYCAWEERARTLITRDEFRQDLRQNLAELRRFGAPPPGRPRLFLPPYEWYNEDQVRWARELGVTLINFTPGSGSNRDYAPENDPMFASSAAIREGILACERDDPHGLNGFLLLLHVGSQRRDKMHAELARLLDALLARGYRFVRVDEWFDT